MKFIVTGVTFRSRLFFIKQTLVSDLAELFLKTNEQEIKQNEHFIGLLNKENYKISRKSLSTFKKRFNRNFDNEGGSV